MNDAIKPCPNCGGTNRLKALPHQIVWCADCGAISCPKCGSPRVINGKVKSWELPSLSCLTCGWREELPMGIVRKMSKEEWQYVRPAGARNMAPCKGGCGRMVDLRGKLASRTGLCSRCYAVANAAAALRLKEMRAKKERKAA